MVWAGKIKPSLEEEQKKTVARLKNTDGKEYDLSLRPALRYRGHKLQGS